MFLSTEYQNKALAAHYGSDHDDDWPATITVHLYDGDPRDGGTELGSAGGYAALSITNNDTSFPVPTTGDLTTVDFDFVFTGAPSAPPTWGVLSDGTTLIEGGPLPTVPNITAAGGTVTVSAHIYYPDNV